MLRNAIRAFTLFLFVALPAAACSSSSSGPAGLLQTRVPSVQLAQHFDTMTVGDTVQAWLLPMLPPGYVPSVEWSSSDSQVVRVLSTGHASADVVGLHVGEAVVHVAGAGAQDSLHVVVTAGQP